ncbi:MAG: hypothetical protein IT305_22550 [Chloroflexi bacterium]|nr:hypothetical protein [Chloroflexota bacterium]
MRVDAAVLTTSLDGAATHGRVLRCQGEDLDSVAHQVLALPSPAAVQAPTELVAAVGGIAAGAVTMRASNAVAGGSMPYRHRDPEQTTS